MLGMTAPQSPWGARPWKVKTCMPETNIYVLCVPVTRFPVSLSLIRAKTHSGTDLVCSTVTLTSGICPAFSSEGASRLVMVTSGPTAARLMVKFLLSETRSPMPRSLGTSVVIAFRATLPRIRDSSSIIFHKGKIDLYE